jgi:hypothetical protein
MSRRLLRRRSRQLPWSGAFAVSAGLFALAWAVGIPLYHRLHGTHPNWTAVHIGAWGLFALLAAAACIHSCFQRRHAPRRPPRGGQRVVHLRLVDGRGKAPIPGDQEQRAA